MQIALSSCSVLLAASENVLREGQPCDQLFSIERGFVLSAGRVLGAGKLFGHECLVGNTARLAACKQAR